MTQVDLHRPVSGVDIEFGYLGNLGITPISLFCEHRTRFHNIIMYATRKTCITDGYNMNIHNHHGYNMYQT